MKTRYIVAIGIASLILGYTLGSLFKEAKVVEIVTEKLVEVEKIVEVEKVVEKIVKVESVQANKDTVKITKPDGTVIERTSEEFVSDTSTDSQKQTDSARSEERTAERTIEIEREVIMRNNWGLGVYLSKDISSLTHISPSDIHVSASRRVIGDIWLDSGWKVNTLEFSLGASIQF